MNLRTAARTLAALVAVAAGVSCKDSSAPPTIGPPSQLVLVSSVGISAFANSFVQGPIQISVQDASGHPLPNQTVSFAVIDGGGLLDASTATSDANGTVTVPAWRLGKLALPQKVRATLGSITKDIDASVTTLYNVELRFFGSPLPTAAQQQLFTNAAARIRGIVTGELVDAQANNVDLSVCGINGQPALNGVIDDLVIYASIAPIDGPNKVLARAGPCLGRQSGGNFMTAVGTMQFDSDDIATLTGAGSFQEVITHEMLHVLGFGVFWTSPPRAFLADTGTSDPRYTGALARQGCVTIGGTVTCAASVPVEATGGTGTALSHWRETTFDNELMTGFIDASPNPLSAMTIGSLADLGYTINNAAADTYTIPGGQLRTSNLLAASNQGAWETMPPSGLYILENGKARRLQR
ncbi:MAG TPA: leishmanolysin-related zinc metalloendopeptidase [Gemmatimonadaceae bacterium]|nr:leishmanolysin-related zinc metalloendopeptidase [Gemmatimonadaceae bacterium]